MYRREDGAGVVMEIWGGLSVYDSYECGESVETLKPLENDGKSAD